MYGFPSGLEDTQGAPTAWTEMQSLTLDKGLWHFLHWRATVTAMMDVQLSGDARGLALFNAAPGTLWQQLCSESEAAILAHPCCDRYGRLYVEVEPQLVPVANRSGIPVVHALTGQDLRRSVSIERRTVSPVAQVDLSGVVYSGGLGSSLFSLSPGHIPRWLGGGIEQKDRLALSSQAQANMLAGLVLGWLGNVYPSVALPLAANHRMVDVCPHQYLTLGLVEADTGRGIVWSGQALTPRVVSFHLDPASGALLTDVEAEAVTTDSLAMDGDVPPEPPDPAPPGLPDPGPIPEPDLEPGWPDVCIFPTRKAGVWYTTDFTGPDVSAQPTWTQVGTSGDWPGDDEILSFGADTDDPFSNMYAIATTSRDVIKWNGSTWTTILSAASEYQNSGDDLYCGEAGAVAMHLWVDRATDDLYVVICNAVLGDGVLCVYQSSDGGASWTIHTLEGPNDLYAYEGGNVMAYNDRIAVGYCTGSGAGNWTVWYSLDGGGSWYEGDDVGTADYEQRVFVPEHTSEYLRRGYDPYEFRVYSNPWSGTSTEENTDELWDIFEGDPPLVLWGSPSEVGTYRMIQDNHLIVTTDSFANYTDKGALQIPGYNDGSNPQDVAGMAYRVSLVDDDMIVYFKRETHASFPESIFVADGEDDLTPEDKSGSDPTTPTDSIPQSGEGCAFGGPQLYHSGAITLP